MKLGVKRMKSKRSFFSSALILNDLKRFWWISALYALLLFLASPLTLLNKDLDHCIASNITIYLSSVMDGAMIFVVLMPVAISTLIFRYMQNSKSVTVIHSMPYTRLQLYVNHFVSGLILLLVPIFLNTLILAGISNFSGYGLVMEENFVLNWLQNQVWISITLYAVTTAIGMFTGSSIAQIIFTYIYNFLALGFFFGTGVVLSGNIYGFNGVSEEFALEIAKFFPITQIFLLDTQFSNELILIDVAMFIIVGVIGYFVYRYRNLEDAGDVISNEILKPIFKYGVTFCTMITGAVYLRAVFDNSEPNYLCYLLFALIGYATAEMLLRKSFKVWDSYKGYIGYVGVFAIVVLFIHFDFIGYERYVPEISQIEKAFISDYTMDVKDFMASENNRNWGIGMLTEPQNVEMVRNLHEKIVSNRLKEDNNDYGCISISYLLKNGKIVNRVYTSNIADYEEDFGKIKGTREYLNTTNEIFGLSTKKLKTIEVSNQITGKTQTLNDTATLEQIFYAAQESIYQSSDTRYRNYGRRYCVEFMYEFSDEELLSDGAVYEVVHEKETKTYYRSIDVYFSDNDTVLKNELINAGCGDLFTSYENVETIKMKLMNSDQEWKVISDKEKVKSFISKIGELNDFAEDDDIYRIEFFCNTAEEGEEADVRVNIRLFADSSFDEFYK